MVRGYRAGDFEQVVRLLGSVLPDEGVTRGSFQRQVVLDEWFRGEGCWVACEEETVVGFVCAAWRPEDGERGSLVLLGVHPEFRRRGIGSELLARAEASLTTLGVKTVQVGPFGTSYFAPGVGTEYEDGIAFFLARGYSEVYRPLAMKAPLGNPVQVPEWAVERTAAERIVIYPWDEELALPTLEFACSKFGLDWARYVRRAAFDIANGADPLRLVVAVDAAKGPYHVVGFSHYEGERFGPVGVDPEYRGRGIGQVLCWRTLCAQRDAGFREAYFMWSDDKTAERLYNGFGFREWRRFILFRKDL